MLLLPTAVLFLSHFRVVLAGTAVYNLTELLATEAVTADLGLLSEILSDMSEFVGSAKIIHTKHFLDSHIGTEDLALDPGMMTKIYTVHDYLTGLTNSGFDLKMTKCAFPPHVIQLCDEPTPRSGSYWTVLEAEASRTRNCAKPISSTRAQMND
jgi:hypothetical protein